MAGIFAILKKNKLKSIKKKLIKKCALKLKHRGTVHTFKYEKFPLSLFYHQNKPFSNNRILNFSFSENNTDFIVIDGQIYNLKDLNIKYNKVKDVSKDSNLNLISLLNGFREFGPKIFTQTLGSYSGVLYLNHELYAFKDPIGAKPLYYCITDNFFAVSSELKALTLLNKTILPLEPGNVISSSGKKRKFFQFPNIIKKYSISLKFVNNIKRELNKLIRKVVINNIQDEEKIGLLLSGGVDSVIINHIAKDLVSDLRVYTVGTEESKDLSFASEIANRYDLDHSIVKFTLHDLLDVLPEVIYALETFDAGLIRSAIPMFIISRHIEETNHVKVILTAEGGDELFGGYDYLDGLKTIDSLNEGLLNLINNEYKKGLQVNDRIPYYFSIEARTPLFDRRLVEFSLKIPPELKIFKNKYGKATKWILRKAFEKEIPEEFIWRKKQKFTDGDRSQFFIRNYVKNKITNEEFEKEKQITPSITLRSKEELYYWRIFNSKFRLSEESLLEIGVTNNFKV
ncbi:MAG: asparagine synthase-related protein [Candidatus Thorarchaeota archaeon]